MLPNKAPSALIGAADGLIKNKTSASDNFQQFIYQPNPDSLWYF